MPQYPTQLYATNPGGNNSALNVTAPEVVKPAPGTLHRIIVQNPGTGGALTVNDTATVDGVGVANQILSIPFGSLTVGQVITLKTPCAIGIVVSAVPTGGGAVAISYDR
jgi:hypothetical protein